MQDFPLQFDPKHLEAKRADPSDQGQADILNKSGNSNSSSSSSPLPARNHVDISNPYPKQLTQKNQENLNINDFARYLKMYLTQQGGIKNLEVDFFQPYDLGCAFNRSFWSKFDDFWSKFDDFISYLGLF